MGVFVIYNTEPQTDYLSRSHYQHHGKQAYSSSSSHHASPSPTSFSQLSAGSAFAFAGAAFCDCFVLATMKSAMLELPVVISPPEPADRKEVSGCA